MSRPPFGEKRPMAERAQLSKRDDPDRLNRQSRSGGIKANNESNVEGSPGATSSGTNGAKSATPRIVNNDSHSASIVGQNKSRDDLADEHAVYAKRTITRSEKSVERPRRRPGRAEHSTQRVIEYPPASASRVIAHISRSQMKPRNSHQRNTNYPSLDGYRKTSKTEQPDFLYAALDLGTNNCRLLVALPQQAGTFRVVDAYSRIVRLGKGLEKSGKLDEAAMDRAISALRDCAKKLKNQKIKKIRLIATEACRRAKNGALFLERVRNETGLELEIVNRKTEAQLAAVGCSALIDKKADGAVIFDIGGGSSELVLLDRRGRKNSKISKQITSWTSLPVGVVTLSERHGGKVVTRTMFNKMVDDVDQHISQFEGRYDLKEFWSDGRVHLIGTSGTVTTLAGVHLQLPRYDRRQVDGVWLSDTQIDNVINQLIEMDFEQRAANPCIGEERADLVLAGCAILQSIRKTWPAPRLRVADRGLREGILTQLMNQDGVWSKKQQGYGKKGRHQKRRKPRNVTATASAGNTHE